MNYTNSRPRRDAREGRAVDLTGIDLSSPSADMFYKIAEDIAGCLATGRGNSNKSTQLRRFYDEVVMWEEKVQLQPENYPIFLPQIKMLVAKASYSRNRELVDENFVKFIRKCVDGLEAELKNNSPVTLRNFRLLFEAVMGFLKGQNS